LLDESALDESVGLGSGNSSTFFFTDAQCMFQEAATNGAVDWDGDQVAGDNSAVIADLNPSAQRAVPCGSDTSEQFQGRIDWSAQGGLPFWTYAFQCTSAGGD
jgi:hypothetical protein